MESLKSRLAMAIIDYGNSEAADDFDAEDMANYLMETIDELHIKAKDVIMDTYNNLMICPRCHKIIATGTDWTPGYCKECGKPLTGGNRMPMN